MVTGDEAFLLTVVDLVLICDDLVGFETLCRIDNKSKIQIIEI